MAGKRRADTDLNHDNWDQEDETEEAGSFKIASESILQERVIKTARRRVTPGVTEGNLKNAFTGFGGFSKSTNTLTSSGQFNFLSNLNNGKAESAKTNGLDLDNCIDGVKNNQKTETNSSINTLTFKNSNVFIDSSKKLEKPSEYCMKLKALNESVSQWIKSHVDTNPICILTPVFKDYEKHLSEIENTYGKKVEPNVTSESSSSEAKNSLSNKPLMSNEQKITSNFSFGDKKTFSTSKPASESFQFVQKTDSEKSKVEGTSKNIFGTSPLLKSFSTSNEKEKNDTSGSSQEKKVTSFVTPFSNTAAFSFGNKNTSTSSKGFSFDSEKPFTFSNVSAPNKTDAEKNEEALDESDEPPKVEFTPVVETGSIYNIRCKVFAKKDSEFVERGVAQLYLKPVDGSDKTQLIVRADTNLGNLIINTLVLKSMPTTKKGNNVIIVCIPTPECKPPPVTLLIKVKTSNDADKLVELLEKHKK